MTGSCDPSDAAATDWHDEAPDDPHIRRGQLTKDIDMKKSLTAAFLVAALSLSACGGGDDRPSKDELVKVLTDNDMSKKQAECAADAVLDSDLSDEALKALADQDDKFKPSKADTKAQAKVVEAMTKCLT
jgi:hypothetical protein